MRLRFLFAWGFGAELIWESHGIIVGLSIGSLRGFNLLGVWGFCECIYGLLGNICECISGFVTMERRIIIRTYSISLCWLPPLRGAQQPACQIAVGQQAFRHHSRAAYNPQPQTRALIPMTTTYLSHRDSLAGSEPESEPETPKPYDLSLQEQGIRASTEYCFRV